jgi:hypothetical protein
MKRKESKHLVGATWEAVNDRGMTAHIWLERRHKSFETWRWYVVYSDGNYYAGDWCTSYAMCRREIPFRNLSGNPIKFKKIK